MHPAVRLLAVAVALAFAVGPVAAGPSPATDPARAVAADPVLAVAIDDVVAANRSNRSGVHAGDTLLVRGTTNRRPEDNAIDVSVVDGPDADRFGFAVVRSWGTDGVWSARLDVPENVIPGAYTLEVRIGGETDVETFEVVERRAALGRASWSVTGDEHGATVVVGNVTLPNGGYVEIRDGGGVVGRSDYLAPGRHDRIAVDADVTPDARAVAVRGAPERVGDPYRRGGDVVAVPVRGVPVRPPPTTAAPTATVTTTRAETPTLPATPPATPRSTTGGSAPGFGILAAVLALVLVLADP
jgi:hypothetical protein